MIDLPAKRPEWASGAMERAARLGDELARSIASGEPHGRQRQLKTALQGAEIAIALGARLAEVDHVPVNVQRLSVVAGLDFVAYPVELFSGLARALELTSGGRAIAVGPANGYLGYVPTNEAFATGGYEADTCIVGPGAGELLVGATIERLFGS